MNQICSWIALAGPFLTQSPSPTELDGDQGLTFYWIDPIDAADRMVARQEFADHLYFYYERQESEQRPTKRAFGRANSGLVFQEAQLLDPFSVPMLHLFYGDKSFSRAHRGHYPIYGEDGKTKNAKYACFPYICKKHANMHIFSLNAKGMQICSYNHITMFSREPFERA